MRRWRPFFVLVLAAAVAGWGCHKGSTVVSLTIAPTAATALINNTVQFSPTETGSTAAIDWAVTGGSTNGTISTGGLYTAPSAVPTNPVVTITATISGTSTAASATVTIQSGVQVIIQSGPSTIGTGETFQFVATVTGVPSSAILAPSTALPSGCNSVSPNPPTLPSCSAVKWTVSTGGGQIDANTGLYSAIGTTTTTATVTATSLYDMNQTSIALFTIVTAADPTLLSVGPKSGTRGATFEDVYLTGTNFISSTIVRINNTPVPQADVVVSPVTCSTIDNGSSTTFIAPCSSSSLTSGSTILRVRVQDSFLAALSPALPFTGAVSLTFTVQRQNGTPQPCAGSDPTLCQVTLFPQSPVIVGLNKPVLPLPSGGNFLFTINGGFFGDLSSSTPSPLVSAQFSGQAATAALSPSNSDLKLNITAGGSLAPQAGLYQTSVTSDTSGLPPAFANIALQETFPAPPTAFAAIPVGNKPWAVGINTATGLAVVANQLSNDVTFIDLTATPPAVVGSLCTVSGTEPSCPAAGPTGVAVDNIRNIALVTNSTANTISVIDLSTKALVPVVGNPINLSAVINNTTISQVPVAVGINPTSATAIVVYRGTNFGLLLDLTPLDASPRTAPLVKIKGIVTMQNGSNPRVAVSTKLNWALVTPGGLGALSLVNLGQQSTNTLQGAPMSSGSTVTVTTTATHTLSVGQPVLIQTPNPPNAPTNVGLVTVTAVPTSTTFSYTLPTGMSLPVAGSTISYAGPLGTFAADLTVTGVGINEETGQAVLADPTNGATPVSIFSLLDQSSTSVSNTSNQLPAAGTIGAAFNPLDDIAVVVNQTNSTGYVIDPTTPLVLSSFTTGSNPWDVAIDPGTDTAVVLNQGDNKVSVVPLGGIRTPQVIEVQTDCAKFASNDVCGPAGEIFVPSTPNGALTSSGSVNLTIVGKGFDSSSKVFLDGAQFTPSATLDRTITVAVPSSTFTGPHRYSLYVSNSSGAVSNVSYLRAISSISVKSADFPTGCSSTPQPTGVAIDAPNNLALVTDSACNSLYVLDATTGLKNGSSGIVAVGANPIGVAVSPQGGSATVAGAGQGYIVAVANTGSQTVSIVDDVNMTLLANVSTDANPTGVAIDPVLGQVVVTDNGAGTADIFPTTTSATTVGGTSTTAPVASGVGQGPVAVAVDPTLHIAAVGNSVGNSVSFIPLVSSSFSGSTLSVALPLGIVFDPISSQFIISSSLSNALIFENPTTGQISSVGVGINPTSIAYNFATGTLVTANSASNTMTVVDFISQLVREVFPMNSSGVFSVAINPQTNVAVVADSLNQRILYVPLP